MEVENSMGSEQCGRRPTVVIQNNVGNRYSKTTIVAFVTSQKKKKLPTHVNLHCKGLSKQSIVMLEQVRTISIYRLKTYIGTLSRRDMKKIDTALKISLGCEKGG